MVVVELVLGFGVFGKGEATPVLNDGQIGGVLDSSLELPLGSLWDKRKVTIVCID